MSRLRTIAAGSVAVLLLGLITACGDDTDGDCVDAMALAAAVRAVPNPVRQGPKGPKSKPRGGAPAVVGIIVTDDDCD